MWVFLSNSFLSIVEHDQDSSLLHIRARFKGDIEEVFASADVIETPHADYRFRATLPRERVAEAMARYVKNIAYTNFKDSVKASGRKDAYIKVWETMWSAQHKGG